MREYVIHEDVTGSYHDTALGELSFAFPAGPYTPRSEADEIVLERQLVPTGLAYATEQLDPGRWDTEPTLAASKTEADSDGGDPGPGPYPDDGSEQEVLAWVAGDPARARHALDVEGARERPRKRLSAALRALLGDEPDGQSTDDTPDAED